VGLTELSLSHHLAGWDVAELFRGPACRLENLQNLLLDDCKLGDAGAEALGGAAVLCSLRLLSVDQNRIGDRGVAALAASPHLAGLTDLHLWANALTDAGVRAILASDHLRKLRKLELGENPEITDDIARAILADRRPWAKVGLDGTAVSARQKAKIEAHTRRHAGDAE
jgi:hypothetical protein